MKNSQFPEDSTTLDLRNSLLTQVQFFDPDKEGMQTRLLNLSERDDRIRLSKLVIWAMNHSIELRVNRIPYMGDFKEGKVTSKRANR